MCFFTLKLITHAVQTFSWAQTSLMKLSEGLQLTDNLCFCPESRKTHHSKYNPWSYSFPPDLLSCPVSLEWAGGEDSPKGRPSMEALVSVAPSPSAWERFVLAASVDRLSNSHREAPSALTQKSRARLVLQDVLYFPCTRNMWIVDKKGLKAESLKQVVEISFTLELRREAFILINISSKFLSCR